MPRLAKENRKACLTMGNKNGMIDRTGELSEWLKEPVLKTGDSERNLGFESLTLRQRITVILIQQDDGYFIPKISILRTFRKRDF